MTRHSDQFKKMLLEAADGDVDKAASFADTMERIGDVLGGRRSRPGGAGCTFPHCICNSPWEKCERKRAK